MAERYLLDTGFLVALVDAADPDHDACAEAWRSVRGELHSVEGTMVEAAHLLGNDPGAVTGAIALIRRAKVELAPPSHARADRATVLMAQYCDVPMDYVDADLVALAEQVQVTTALTLDVRGFSAFRMRGTLAFTILPAPSSRHTSSRRRRRRQ